MLYIDGGWETLIHGLTSKAKAMGVAIETGISVEHVGAGTILAVPPEDVERLTGLRLAPRTPVRAACLDLGLHVLPKDSALFGMDLNEPLYLSVHSASARLAPEGSALVQIVEICERTKPRIGSNWKRLRISFYRGGAAKWRLRDAFPNMIVSHAIPAPAGRAPVQIPGLPGVAVAGDWVGLATCWRMLPPRADCGLRN